MIYIVERHVEDYLHVLANVNTLKIFGKVFSEEKICFISAHAHNLKVKEYFNNTDSLIEFSTFTNRRPVKNIILRALSLIKRAIDDVFFFKRLFDKSSTNDILIVSHIYPHSLILFNLLKRFYPNHVALIMLHGEVEYTVFARSSAQKVIGAIYKFCFKITPPQLNYIFLTKAAGKIIADSSFSISEKSVFIELPTIQAEKALVQKAADNRAPCKIGHIGSAGKRKNVEQLYLLADQLHDLITKNTVQLSVIGVLEASIKPYLKPLVINFVNDQIDQPISRSVYDQEIVRLNYAIFFYGLNDFLLRSSAAFFDAVWHEKPIIAIKNTFFSDLFKTHGVMGYLFDNLEDMQAHIRKIAFETEEIRSQIPHFTTNIKAYKATLSLDSVSVDLKMQLTNLLPDAVVKKYRMAI